MTKVTTQTQHLRCDEFSQLSGIKHGFFTRLGGVSSGVYTGLNMGFGSNDDMNNVAENRARAMRDFGAHPDALCTLSQIHSAKVVHVNEDGHHKPAPEADAMVTAMSGVVLGILTADCTPVLFADPVNRVVGAAHAGWKGAGLGVTHETVTEMLKLGAETRYISAVIGPCIHQESYEVDAGFKAKFHPVDHVFFVASQNSGKFQFDLPGFVEKKLSELQLKSVTRINRNTYTDEDHFYSYRRKTHRNEEDYGRQVSVVMLD